MFFRMIFGLPGAAFITALLFLAMGWMIRTQEPQIDEPTIIDVAILPTIKDSDLIDQSKKTPRTDLSKAPETKIDLPKKTGQVGPIEIGPLPGPKKGDGAITLPPVLTPTVKIPPGYPENCLAKGAQGAVVVEFDVTAEGTVANPRIVSSADSCFDRAVMRAIVNWKYSPQTDGDGRPITRRGVRETLVFELTE